MTSDLPLHVERELLERWREPRRRYHGERHLLDGLAALRLLGAGRLERIAFWFHDAIHTGSSPADEVASAGLAQELLNGVLPGPEAAEVCRLVLVTSDHDPAPTDAAGARVSDADLAAIASPWDTYCGNLEAIRAECPGVDTEAWHGLRRSFIEQLEGRAEIFRTPQGRQLWEQGARRNLAHERSLLTTRPGSGKSGA